MELIRRGNYIHLYHGKNKLASIWPTGLFISLPFHKGFELEFYFRKKFWQWFYLNTGWSRKMDHAGLSFDLEIMYLVFNFSIYDGRHWNEKADRYYLPGEEQAERESRR